MPTLLMRKLRLKRVNNLVMGGAGLELSLSVPCRPSVIICEVTVWLLVGREGAQDQQGPLPCPADCASEGRTDAGQKPMNFKLFSRAVSSNLAAAMISKKLCSKVEGFWRLSVHIESTQASPRHSSLGRPQGYTQQPFAVCGFS